MCVFWTETKKNGDKDDPRKDGHKCYQICYQLISSRVAYELSTNKCFSVRMYMYFMYNLSVHFKKRHAYIKCGHYTWLYKYKYNHILRLYLYCFTDESDFFLFFFFLIYSNDDEN